MQILIKLLVLVAVFVAIDFTLLDGRYSTQAWQQAQRQGQTISTEVTRWLNKAKL